MIGFFLISGSGLIPFAIWPSLDIFEVHNFRERNEFLKMEGMEMVLWRFANLSKMRVSQIFHLFLNFIFWRF
jgi:hypothetical protein